MSYQALEGAVISRLELVLPKNVLQTCITLQRGFAAEFLSTNFQKSTTNRIKVAKQIDESVRLTVTVSKLLTDNRDRPEHILIQGLKDNKIHDPIAPQNKSDDNTECPNEQSLSPTIPKQSSIENSEGNSAVQSLTENEEVEKVTEECNARNVESVYEEPTRDEMTQPSSNEEGPAGAQCDPPSEELGQLDNQTTETSKPLVPDTENTPQVSPSCERDDVNLSTLTSSGVDDLGKPNDNLTSDILSCAADVLMPKALGGWKLKPDEQDADRQSINESPKDDDCDFSKSVESPQEAKRSKKTIVTPGSSGNTVQTRSLRSRTLKPMSNVEDNETSSVHERVPSDDVDSSTDKGLINGKNKPSHTRTVRPTPTLDRSHMKRPHYKREPNVQCQFCPAKLKDRDSLFDHARLKHSHLKGYSQFVSELRQSMKVSCQVCQRVYSRRDQLAVHMRLVHSPTTTVDCPQCGISVKSEKHLKDHLRRIHNNTGRVYLCHLCPAAFKVQAYLSAHLKYVHTNNKGDAFPCDQCDKTYSTEKYLRNHKMRVHGSKRHTCGFCGKAFTTYPNMRRHVVLLHEKKGDKPFPCHTCGRRFSLKANWKDHVNTIHLNSYSLRCPVCQLGFRRKKDLQTHEAHAHGAAVGTATPVLRHLAPADGEGPITVVPVCDDPQPAEQLPAQEGSGAVQYIIATPEMLQAFGIQMAPEGGAMDTEPILGTEVLGTEVHHTNPTGLDDEPTGVILGTEAIPANTAELGDKHTETIVGNEAQTDNTGLVHEQSEPFLDPEAQQANNTGLGDEQTMGPEHLGSEKDLVEQTNEETGLSDANGPSLLLDNSLSNTISVSVPQ